MRDETVEQSRGNGLVLRCDFDVKPGKYLVRAVIRDLEGRQTTAQNAIVEEEK